MDIRTPPRIFRFLEISWNILKHLTTMMSFWKKTLLINQPMGIGHQCLTTSRNHRPFLNADLRETSNLRCKILGWNVAQTSIASQNHSCQRRPSLSLGNFNLWLLNIVNWVVSGEQGPLDLGNGNYWKLMRALALKRPSCHWQNTHHLFLFGKTQ